jgi:hypothetical protein
MRQTMFFSGFAPSKSGTSGKDGRIICNPFNRNVNDGNNYTLIRRCDRSVDWRLILKSRV